MISADTPFEQWYESEHKRVLAAVIMVSGDNGGRAEDAVTDAFIKAYERWGKVSQMESPTGWVTRVAINNSKRWFRKRAPSMSTTAGLADTYPDVDLWRAVSALPQRQREALVLRYVDDFTQQQVAAELDVAAGTAAATLHKARNNLRSALAQGESND